MTWEDVEHLDEHNVNLVQYYNRELGELVIITEEGDAEITYIRVYAEPEYDGDELSYLTDTEQLQYSAFKQDEMWVAYNMLIAYIVKNP